MNKVILETAVAVSSRISANLLETRETNTAWLKQHVLQDLSGGTTEENYLRTLLDIAAEALTIHTQFVAEQRGDK